MYMRNSRAKHDIASQFNSLFAAIDLRCRFSSRADGVIQAG